MSLFRFIWVYLVCKFDFSPVLTYFRNFHFLELTFMIDIFPILVRKLSEIEQLSIELFVCLKLVEAIQTNQVQLTFS